MAKNKKKKIKICFASSSGGHYEQLLMLKPIMDKYDSFVVTERTKYGARNNGKKTYFLHQVNRKEFSCIFKLVCNAFKSLFLIIKKRPNVVITTGVLAMIPLCLLAKFFGAKLIYIESFAKVNSPTETGKYLYKKADRFYVQWEQMLKYYPDAIYLGGIY